MKFLALTIAALLAALALSAPPAAYAAAKVEPYSKEQIAKGAKAAEVVQSAGLPCTVTDAAFISEGEGKNPDDPKGKDLKVSSYEVACQQGMGYILQNYVGIPVKIYDCVSLAATPSPCRLPENTDPKKLLSSLVAASGRTCTVNNERALGATKAGDRFYEVGCAEGPGFILQASAPTSATPPKAEDCARAIGTNLECKFTTKEQIAAAMTARLTALVAASGKPCAITGSREVGADSSGVAYYEVACSSGLGYMMAEKNGALVRAIDCANARPLAGGCTLTDATKAESAESGTYSRLAAAGGYPCQVAKYRYIGLDNASNSEVVELQCSNRPDGAVALFPTNNKGPAKFYDCVAAGALGESCKLSDPAAVYAKYTAALAAKGKTTCKVSGAKWLGSTAAGDTYVETACADGLPGWVVAMTPAGSAAEVLTCGQAKSAGVSCSLPTNLK
jgi:hypothetical protein